MESQFLYGKWNDDPVIGHLYIEKAAENHYEERRYDSLQIDNQKQTIRKFEAKIRRYEDNLLTAYITVRV